MDKKKIAVPLVCHGHSRPVVDLFYSPVTPDGFFLISASKGNYYLLGLWFLFFCKMHYDFVVYLLSLERGLYTSNLFS